MAVTQYIGARYVPVMADPIEWSSAKSYEPLTIVVHQGNSYTSRQTVPVGIDITNTDFWALTGNYNAQIEQYRREVQTFDDRITTNEGNIAQNAQAIATLQGDVQGALDDIEDAQADILQHSNEIADINEDVFANTTAIGTNAQGIADNTSAIAASNAEIDVLQGQIEGTEGSGLLTLIQTNAQGIAELASIPNEIKVEGARPILRYECGITENTQGGLYFEQDGVPYYAVARIISGNVATVVDIYNLETQYKAGTCTGSFAHGNSMSYHDKHLYVGGSDESAIFTEIDCTSISTPYVSRSYDLSALGETRVWGFGVYDDTHFWYTPNNNAIYKCTFQLTDKEIICYAINPTYMAAVQQGVSYDRESDTFISCKSGYIVMFGSDGVLKGGYRFDWQYGYIFTGEVEQATMVDGKVYFHNNCYVALPAGFTDYRRVNAAWVWDPKAPVYSEPFVMPLGARGIHIDTTQPTIPNFDRVAPDYWHYPLDAAAYMLAHPEGGRTYQVDTDTPFVCIIPPNVNTVNLNGHGVGGVALMNGASVALTGNVAYATNSPETTMLTTTYNDRKLVCAGRSNLFTFFGSTPADESVWIYNQYGGAAIATEGKLAYVTGSGAKIQL